MELNNTTGRETMNDPMYAIGEIIYDCNNPNVCGEVEDIMLVHGGHGPFWGYTTNSGYMIKEKNVKIKEEEA